MEQKLEGKLKRRHYSVLGWALVIYLLLLNACVNLAVLAESVAISFRQMAGEVISQEQITASLMGNAWGYLLAIALGLIFLWLWKGKKFCTETLWVRGKPMGFGSFLALVCLFTSGQAAFQIIATIQETLLNSFGLSALDAIQSATMSADTFSMFLYGCVAAPIAEEILFRGLVLRHLEPHGRRFAIVMSAFTFAVFHGNLVQIPYTFLVGLILGYVAAEYNILWAMVLHMINNLLLGDMLNRLTQGLPEEVDNAILLLIVWGCALGALVICMVNRDEAEKYCRDDPIDDRSAGYFFSSPGILALTMLTVVSLVMQLF